MAEEQRSIYFKGFYPDDGCYGDFGQSGGLQYFVYLDRDYKRMREVMGLKNKKMDLWQVCKDFNFASVVHWKRFGCSRYMSFEAGRWGSSVVRQNLIVEASPEEVGVESPDMRETSWLGGLQTWHW